MVSILSDEWIYIHKANKHWIRRFLITKNSAAQPGYELKKKLKKYCSLQNLLRSGTCPEIQSFLHVKEPSRKAWKKVYFFLRRSGLYCSTKGSSKVRESGQQVWDAQNGPTACSLKVCVCLCGPPGASSPAVCGRPGGSERVHCGEQPQTLRSSCRLHLLYQGDHFLSTLLWEHGAVGEQRAVGT